MPEPQHFTDRVDAVDAMTTLKTNPITVTQPGWYRDPREIHQLRYFDGTDWTTHVTHSGPTPCDRCFDRGPDHY